MPQARDWNGHEFRVAAIDRVADLATGSPHLRAKPFGRAANDRAGIVAPRPGGGNALFPSTFFTSLGLIAPARIDDPVAESAVGSGNSIKRRFETEPTSVIAMHA